MRTPLLRGRLIESSDLAPGAAAGHRHQRRNGTALLARGGGVGKRIKYGLDPAATNPWKTVVGVVADMRRQRLDEPAIPFMFQPGINRQMDIAVRTANDPNSAA